MAEYRIKDTTLTALADPIRTLAGSEDKMSTSDMATAVNDANDVIDSQSELIAQIVSALVGKSGSSGVELPTLSNEGSASDLLSGKELIDGSGDVVTGTFTIDTELTTQGSLISQLKTSLQNKAVATPTLQTKTVTPTTSIQTVTADSEYYGLSEVTVDAIPTATQASPTISVSSDGVITASSNQSAGYVSAGVKTATKQLITQEAQTITPTTTGQTIASGTYLTGTQTIEGDANLIATNIKSGVSIFWVYGTYEGSGSGDSSSGIETTGSVAILYSTAEGSVIHTESLTDGFSTSEVDLAYFSTAGKYRAIIYGTALLNVPIVVLTSGTITFGSPTGCVSNLIASGTGYAVYVIEKSSDSGEDEGALPAPG